MNPSLRPSQYTDQFVDESYTLTCTAPDGTVLETTTIKIARGQLANRSLCTQGGVGGSVPATLALTLGAPATFGAFTPGIAKEYDASTTANVDQHGRQRGAERRRRRPGQHGQARQRRVRAPAAAARRRDEPRGHRRPARPDRRLRDPTSLLTYSGPVSNDPVTVAFKQAIGANDALRTGTYSKTLTFTLSTTNP